MKNNKLRTFFFSLILVLSVGSYAFIQSVNVPNKNIKCQAKQMLEEENTAELPDVKLIKKIIENGKKLIPAARF